jgi:hypothetical protein
MEFRSLVDSTHSKDYFYDRLLEMGKVKNEDNVLLLRFFFVVLGK